MGQAAYAYSAEERQISEATIKQIVSSVRVRSLDSKEEKLVEEALIKRRGRDGRLSMRQAYEALISLEGSRKISQYDREGILKQLEQHLT